MERSRCARLSDGISLPSAPTDTSSLDCTHKDHARVAKVGSEHLGFRIVRDALPWLCSAHIPKLPGTKRMSELFAEICRGMDRGVAALFDRFIRVRARHGFSEKGNPAEAYPRHT